MQITKQADYAIRAVMYLSEKYDSNKELNGQELIATRKIANEKHIPASFLAKIISQLEGKELVTTSRGASGGVGLARQPKDISLLDVVEAIDNRIYLNVCVKDINNCTFGDECYLRPIWCEVQEELVNKLKATRFDQFSNGNKK